MSIKETVVSIYRDPADARRAIDALVDAGFDKEKIGVLAHTTEGKTTIQSVDGDEGSHAGAGAAIGAAAGAGGGALWALGIAAGVLPAIGPVIAGGLLAAVLASAATGAVAGGLVGTLVGLGIPDEDAEYYHEEFKDGRTVVVVQAGTRGSDCRDVMFRHRGYDRASAPASDAAARGSGMRS